jgi:hypothetical protein
VSNASLKSSGGAKLDRNIIHQNSKATRNHKKGIDFSRQLNILPAHSDGIPSRNLRLSTLNGIQGDASNSNSIVGSRYALRIKHETKKVYF